jgi:hypothetical protein
MNNEPNVGLAVVVMGLIVVLAGLLWIMAPSIPWFGRLPGDIRLEGKSFSFYFPLASCLLLSVVLSAILWAFRLLRR